MGFAPEQKIIVDVAADNSKWWVPIAVAVIGGLVALWKTTRKKSS